MIILPQYEYEVQLYSKTPIKDRWIFNKLAVAELLNYECGPCGDVMRKVGTYCVRPIMNLHGCGVGGWIKHYYDGTRYCQPEYRPGWFWMPWFEGRHVWTEYINDIPIRQAGGYMNNNILEWKQSYDFIQLPNILKGFSKYMCAESIGGNIIEVAPKHLADNKDSIMDMKLSTDIQGNYIWEEMFETAKPWRNL